MTVTTTIDCEPIEADAILWKGRQIDYTDAAKCEEIIRYLLADGRRNRKDAQQEREFWAGISRSRR